MKKYYFLVLLLFSNALFAWGVTGHLVISQIAYDHLTSTAKVKVDNLIAVFAKQYPTFNTFELMSDWPDTLRNQNINAFNGWHFIDRPLSFGQHRYERYDKENVVWAINQSEQVLSSPTADPVSQAMFLAFLTHFVGDAHQPLHCVTLYSAQFPQGDQGGNLYFIQSNIAQNLHSYWDQGAGFYAQYRPAVLSMAGVSALAKKIESDYPADFFKGQQNNTNPKEWTYQSYDIAKNFVYTTPYNQPISVAYQAKAQQITEQQTALAGYRLAAVLNQLLG